jgi:hypothetical protein
MNMIGLLSTPEYDDRFPNPGQTNFVSAIVHAMTGSAVQQNGANQLMAFRYQLTVENTPWNSVGYDSTNWNNVPPNNVCPYATNSPDYIIRSNRWWQVAFLTNQLHEVRVKLAWPVLPNGGIGPNQRTYRSLISGHLLLTNFFFNGTRMTNWFFRPQSYNSNTLAF